MARKLKTDDPNVIEQYSGPMPSADGEQRPDGPPLVPEFVHHGPAVAAVQPSAPSVPTVQPTHQPVKVYRVRVGGPILCRGVRTVLKPGKIVDERMYDVPMLLTQGIVLDPV